MPEGGKLTIETRNIIMDEEYASHHIGVRPGRHVMLAVTDTGTGMDAETKRRVFEPFFSTKEVGHGTGLGLSMVYGIVKQSNGSIWVYSEPGRGTTFKIYLPVVDEDVTNAAEINAELVLNGSETILIVEDDELVRKLTSDVLKMFGYRVLTAANGAEAIAAYEATEQTIDLLLTDVVMPIMSGRELADRMAELFPDILILFMSGYTDNAVVHQGVLDADAHFIQKPFHTDALVKKIREVLDSGMRQG
jgi:CheY-like chemotaxis protein